MATQKPDDFTVEHLNVQTSAQIPPLPGGGSWRLVDNVWVDNNASVSEATTATQPGEE